MKKMFEGEKIILSVKREIWVLGFNIGLFYLGNFIIKR